MRTPGWWIFLTLVASCYNPNLPSGTQRCGPNGACGPGFACGGDGFCYKAGQAPPPTDMAMVVATPDLAGSEPDLAMRLDLVMPDLTPACSPQNCAAPMVCDPKSGKCVACLPAAGMTADTCPPGSFCESVNGVLQCSMGCKTNDECNPMPDGGVEDGGDSDGGDAPDGGVLPARKMACCKNRCVDLNSDAANCGACSTSCNGLACCTGSCEDTTKDLDHCGACGRACAGKGATWTCDKSMCAVAGCVGNFLDCDKDPANGCEANKQSDPKNCLGCGKVCAAADAVTTCMGGCFIQSCKKGFHDCNLKYDDGCETPSSADVNNCGGCMKKCPIPTNAMTAACTDSMCGVGLCKAGFGDCNANAADGCETNLNTEVNHCAKCGMKCMPPAHATAKCNNGKCEVGVCEAGWADCNGNPADGCETDVANDVNNCKTCNTKCPAVAGGVAACANSACVIKSCNAPLADCNKVYNDGCEADTSKDKANCGMCMKACGVNENCMNSMCMGVMLPGCFRTTDVLQMGLNPQKPQYTKCESIANNGFTCNNPLIRYGTVPNGVPSQHQGNDFNIWCKSLGCAGGWTGQVSYGNRSYMIPFGKLFGCTSYDDNVWHWCDWQDGPWFNQQLDAHYADDGMAIVSITCK